MIRSAALHVELSFMLMTHTYHLSSVVDDESITAGALNRDLERQICSCCILMLIKRRQLYFLV